MHDGFDVLSQTETLEGSHRLTVESNGAWDIEERRPSFEDHDAQAGVGELQGGHRSNRAVAYDRDVKTLLVHAKSSSGTGYPGLFEPHYTSGQLGYSSV